MNLVIIISLETNLRAEIRDYRKLMEIGIKMPAMLDADVKNERILKEFIDWRHDLSVGFRRQDEN